MVGGQDRLTSFAVQDNELWHRHLIWLFLQLCTTGYVFIQSVHQNRLRIPTLLLLLAGKIKYAERTIALYLASSNSFGISILKEPNIGPYDYDRLQIVYSHYKESNIPVNFVLLEERESDIARYIRFFGTLNDSDLLQYAHHFANMYKGLIINLIFSSREHHESRDFFSNITAEQTLRVLGIELNIFYDLLHTKVVGVNSKQGKFVRCISFGLVVAALSLFHKVDKHGIKSFDVKLTYILFLGVLGMDVVTHLLWMFSDWSTVSSFSKYAKYFPLAEIQSKIFNELLSLRRPRWKKSKQRTKAETASTPIIFKRWSETLPQFNFIECCWREIKIRIMITKILKYMHIKYFIGQKKNDIRQIYVNVQPLTLNLWQFIFDELLKKSRYADDIEEAKRITSARGELALENCDFIDCGELMPYVKDVAYDESLLLWHIATELCYNTDEHSHSGPSDICHCCDYCDDACDDFAHFSKYLSDYMLYLLYQQPSLMSEVSGIANQRFRDTWTEAQRFCKQYAQQGHKHSKKDYVRYLILNVAHVKGDPSKSALFGACTLAKELIKLGTQKWEIMSKVWVELLSYAASRSKGNGHVQQLSKGGELLTFVWLLMAHFGLRESWLETRYNLRLSVNV